MQSCRPSAIRMPVDFTETATLLRAAADPHRLAILAALAQSESDICVCDFTAGLPVNQPAVSHHLKVLRDSGLVTCERRGTWVYYRLADGAAERLHTALVLALPEKVTAETEARDGTGSTGGAGACCTA